MSSAFLAKLRELLAAFQEVHQQREAFWARYQEARHRPGWYFPDVRPKWSGFQRAFLAAGQRLREAQGAMPDRGQLPNWTPNEPVRVWYGEPTFHELLRRFAEWFAKGLSRVGDPKEGFFSDFAEWMNGRPTSGGGFTTPGARFESEFIEPLAEAIEKYEVFLAEREAHDLAKALVSPGGPAEGAASAPAPDQVTGQAGSTPPAPAPDQAPRGAEHAQARKRAVAFLANAAPGFDLGMVADILTGDATINKLRSLAETMPTRMATATLAELADLLQVTKQAIQKSEWWRTYRAGEGAAGVEDRRRRLRERSDTVDFG